LCTGASKKPVEYTIFTQPYIKAIHIVGDKIKSRNTARKYLDQLCEIQALELKHIAKSPLFNNLQTVILLEVCTQ